MGGYSEREVTRERSELRLSAVNPYSRHVTPDACPLDKNL